MNKVLILGGAHQHVKLVEAAHRLGYYAIVADYLTDSPAKRIADKACLVDIKDIGALECLCKEEGVNGVIAGFLDPCQMPYALLCERLNLPCFGTVEQFYKLTNKIAFKDVCNGYGVGTIKTYKEENISEKFDEYPLFIKPTDSRGSRGQSVCRKYEDVQPAIELAKSESSDGKCIIEKYLGDCDEVQITIFMENGVPHLERTVDSYRGGVDFSLEKVVNCSISPSKHTREFILNSYPQIINMINGLGIKNGPVFMQGFVKNGQFYFFDPGLRFPGVEYERIFSTVFNISLEEWLVYYSVYGTFPKGVKFPKEAYNLSGKKATVLFPVLLPGKIKDIKGESEFASLPSTVAYTTRYGVGDEVPAAYNVNQRYAEIDMVAEDIIGISTLINKFQKEVIIINQQNECMLFDDFDTTRLSNGYEK